MNPPAVKLRDLLSLREQLCSPDEADDLRRRIAADPNLAARWATLQQQPESGGAGAGSVQINPQVIAQFIDGRLPQEKVDRLEARCWQDPELLQEVADCFRLVHQASSTARPPKELTRRLISLLGGDPAGHETSRDADTIVWEAGHEADVPAKPAEIFSVDNDQSFSLKVDHRRRASLKPRWSRPAIGAIAAAVIVAMTTGTWIWLQQIKSPTPVADGEKNATETTQQLVMEEPPVPAESQTDPTKDQVEIARSNVFGSFSAPEIEWPSVDNEVADSDAVVVTDTEFLNSVDSPNLPMIADTAPANDSSNNDSTATPLPARLAVEWLEVKGIVAVVAPGLDRWMGPYVHDDLETGSAIHVLPGSWTKLSLGEISEVIVASDSSVQIAFSFDDVDLELTVENGNVALQQLDPGTRIRWRAGAAEWLVEVAEQETSVATDWLDDQPRLFVTNGAAIVNQIQLTPGKQLAWQEMSQAEPSSSGGTPQWMRRLGEELKVSRSTRQRLLESDDVRGELAAMKQEGSSTEAMLAVECLAALEPSTHLVEAIEASDIYTRNASVAWMMTLNPRQARTRQIWQALAQRSDPAAIRTLYQMAVLVRSGRAPTLEQSLTLVRMLRQGDLVQRQVAAMLLARIYSGPIVDVSLSDQQLAVAANHWEQVIRTRHERAQDRPANTRRNRN